MWFYNLKKNSASYLATSWITVHKSAFANFFMLLEEYDGRDLVPTNCFLRKQTVFIFTVRVYFQSPPECASVIFFLDFFTSILRERNTKLSLFARYRIESSSHFTDFYFWRDGTSQEWNHSLSFATFDPVNWYLNFGGIGSAWANSVSQMLISSRSFLSCTSNFLHE